MPGGWNEAVLETTGVRGHASSVVVRQTYKQKDVVSASMEGPSIRIGIRNKGSGRGGHPKVQ